MSDHAVNEGIDDVCRILQRFSAEEQREILVTILAWSYRPGRVQPLSQSAQRTLLGVPVRAGPADVLALLSVYYGVTPELLLGRLRTKTWSEARQVAIFLTRKITGASLSEIARAFGRSDHTTAAAAIAKIQGRIDADAAFREQVAALEARVRQDVLSGITGRGRSIEAPKPTERLAKCAGDAP